MTQVGTVEGLSGYLLILNILSFYGGTSVIVGGSTILLIRSRCSILDTVHISVEPI